MGGHNHSTLSEILTQIAPHSNIPKIDKFSKAASAHRRIILHQRRNGTRTKLTFPPPHNLSMLARRIPLRHIKNPARLFSLSPHSSPQRPDPRRIPTFLRKPSPLDGQFHKPEPQNEHLLSLCANGNFQEAVDLLFRRRGRVGDALELLNSLEKSQCVGVYSPLFHLCLRNDAADEASRVFDHASGRFQPGIFLSNRLIALFARLGHTGCARKVFDEMPERDACSFNTLISCYAKKGNMEEARRVFDFMDSEMRDGFSWSSMMSGYIRERRPWEALELFREMQVKGGFNGNKFTVSSALAAAAAIFSLRSGKEIHGHVIRRELTSDAVVWSALSDTYAKCGDIAAARHIFNDTPDKDIVSWTAMIGRYLEHGRSEEGLVLFSDMLRARVKPNEFTFAAILTVFSERTMEAQGKEAHGNMMRIGWDPSSYAGGALIDMYSKCGNIESARKVFDIFLEKPDLVSWTSLISGLAQNGYPLEALKYFDSLLDSRTKPDHIVFVGVLSACTHAGLVDRGLEIFWSIEKEHSLAHTSDHYACVVDLLSRAGRFREAEDIIRKMPMKPDKFLWASLLGGCRIHGNIRVARMAAEALFQLEPENAATYVTLANIYASAGLWEKVASTRKIMEERGAVKKPGSSWIEVEKKVHRFLVGDDSHPRIKEIHIQLEKLSAKMKEEGYIPNTNFVLHDVEDEQKERDLVYHSEKLAVAFGIIATSAPAAIKVFKNLRICGDCHTAIKFMSRIAKRKIIVRDSSRFHHFIDGTCTCKDYW